MFNVLTFLTGALFVEETARIHQCIPNFISASSNSDRCMCNEILLHEPFPCRSQVSRCTTSSVISGNGTGSGALFHKLNTPSPIHGPIQGWRTIRNRRTPMIGIRLQLRQSHYSSFTSRSSLAPALRCMSRTASPLPSAWDRTAQTCARRRHERHDRRSRDCRAA